MNRLKVIWQTVIHLPQNIVNLCQHRQRQSVLREQEVERLDRIRNPSKYRGK